MKKVRFVSIRAWKFIFQTFYIYIVYIYIYIYVYNVFYILYNIYIWFVFIFKKFKMFFKTVSSLKYIFWIPRPFTHGTVFLHLQYCFSNTCVGFPSFLQPIDVERLHLLVCVFFIFSFTFSLSTLKAVSGLMVLDFLPEVIALV